jgi:hypothetical protein
MTTTRTTGKLAFLSYRGSVQKSVEPVSNWLVHEMKLVEGVTFIKPEKLALDYEIMMPFECFEFMMAIWGVIEDCDTFVFLETGDYFQSVWTNLEVTGWLFFAESPIGYAVGSDTDGQPIVTPVEWPAMPRESKPMWSQVRSHLSPFAMLRHRQAVYRGGKFATKHYLLACRVCGEYSLLPKQLIESKAKKHGDVHCAHRRCRALHIVKHEGEYNRFRYRAPIVAIPHTKERAPNLRWLSSDELLQLYVDRKKPPPRIEPGSD